MAPGGGTPWAQFPICQPLRLPLFPLRAENQWGGPPSRPEPDVARGKSGGPTSGWAASSGLDSAIPGCLCPILCPPTCLLIHSLTQSSAFPFFPGIVSWAAIGSIAQMFLLPERRRRRGTGKRLGRCPQCMTHAPWGQAVLQLGLHQPGEQQQQQHLGTTNAKDSLCSVKIS